MATKTKPVQMQGGTVYPDQTPVVTYATPPAPIIGSQVTYNGVQGTASPTTPTATAATTDQQSAYDDIQSVLAQYGLSSLASWAWGEITGGKSEAQVVLDLQNQQGFKDAFPEIALRQQAGLPAISVSDILSYRDQATSIMRAAGLPAGFWDSPADFTQLIGGDVSLQELSNRVSLASQAVYQAPKEVLDAFQRDFGVSAGGLAAYFLDPTKAEPLLQQQFAAAQIGGAGTISGYGTTAGIDNQLAGLGVTMQGAMTGFGDLGAKKQLFTTLPGESGQGVSQAQQIGAEFENNADDQALINRIAAQRKAQFAGSGGFEQTSAGFSGLGTARGA